MIGIAFDFCRPALVAPHEQRRRDPAQRICCRKEQTFPGNFFFGLFDVRNNFLGRLNHATAQTCERERCAHQFQERASLDRVVPFFGSVRKFAAHELFEDWRVGKFVEMTPIFLPARYRRRF